MVTTHSVPARPRTHGRRCGSALVVGPSIGTTNRTDCPAPRTEYRYWNGELYKYFLVTGRERAPLTTHQFHTFLVGGSAQASAFRTPWMASASASHCDPVGNRRSGVRLRVRVLGPTGNTTFRWLNNVQPSSFPTFQMGMWENPLETPWVSRHRSSLFHLP